MQPEHTSERHDAAPPALDVLPVPVAGVVSIDGAIEVRVTPPDKTGYMGYVLTGNEPRPIMVAGYDEYRVRVVIQCTGAGPVYIGSEQQLGNVNNAQAAASMFPLATGREITITGKESIWIACATGATATVGVLTERRSG